MRIKYDNHDLKKKLLHTFPEEWKNNVIVLENTKNIITMKVDELIAHIEAMAIDESTRNNSKLKIDPYKFTKVPPGVSALMSEEIEQKFEATESQEFGLIAPPLAPSNSKRSTTSNKSKGNSQKKIVDDSESDEITLKRNENSNGRRQQHQNRSANQNQEKTRTPPSTALVSQQDE
ncbi:hypothetical protein R6Q57_018681 [Mikania cordata]